MQIVVLDGRALEPDTEKWEAIGSLAAADGFQWHPVTSPEQVIERSSHADVLVINKVRLDRSVLDQLPNLKLIAITATGHDNVDKIAAAEKDITVCNVPEYSTDSVAQHVFAMLLSRVHRSFEHDTAIRDGQWQASGQFTFWLSPLAELAGKKMGIVGFGRIGQATARLAVAFGMQVLVYSRTEKQIPGLEDVQWCSVEELFAQADVVSLHCPATDSNEQFVNAQLLKQMKPTSVLINTARGKLIHESDLAQALDAGTLAGACLDVLSSEPPASDNPLLHCKNCLLTPHIAWTTVEARQRLMNIVAENIRAFSSGDPTNQVG